MNIITTSAFIAMTFKSEDHFTSVTNMYISHNYEVLRRLYYHIPNESEDGSHHVRGTFTKHDAYRIKQYSKGVLPGVPDFCFMHPYHWYMELKLPNGKLSPAQQSLFAFWKDKRIIIHVCYDSKQVVDVMIGMIGKPMY